jgi:acetolactate synthase small subunit
MHQPHVFELTVGPQAGVIDRIVGLCRARRCRIVALHYLAADAHAPGVVRLAVSAPAARTRLLGERLRALVDVLGVEDATPGAPARARHTARSVWTSHRTAPDRRE